MRTKLLSVEMPAGSSEAGLASIPYLVSSAFLVPGLSSVR